jgi:hypothetical protein
MVLLIVIWQCSVWSVTVQQIANWGQNNVTTIKLQAEKVLQVDALTARQ